MPVLTHRPQQLPTVGQIRIGEKATTGGGKEYPKKSETFLLTSPNKSALDTAQAVYGGEITPWPSRPGYFMLRTKSRTLKALFNLMPVGDGGDCQSMSTWNEMHTAAGRSRRCDGHVCQLTEKDGTKEVACICKDRVGTDIKQFCSMVTKINVVLPEIDAIGTWRLATRSASFDQEWRAFTGTCRQLVGPVIIPVLLVMTDRESRTVDGGAKQFTVVTPALDPEPASPGAYLAQLASKLVADPAALTAASPALPEPDDDEPDEPEAAGTLFDPPQVALWDDEVFGGKADAMLRQHGVSLQDARSWKAIGVTAGKILTVNEAGLSGQEFRARVLAP